MCYFQGFLLLSLPLRPERVGVNSSWIFFTGEVGGSQFAYENSGLVTPLTPHTVTLNPIVPSCLIS